MGEEREVKQRLAVAGRELFLANSFALLYESKLIFSENLPIMLTICSMLLHTYTI